MNSKNFRYLCLLPAATATLSTDEYPLAAWIVLFSSSLLPKQRKAGGFLLLGSSAFHHLFGTARPSCNIILPQKQPSFS
jgi:hypothetical protein